MSYNHDPDWAEIKIHPWCKAIATCPGCKKDNFEQFKTRLLESAQVDYYTAACVPPTVGIDCPECETEYDVAVEVRIFPAGMGKIGT